MTHVLAQTAARLSAGANALGRFLLAPVGVVPGWLSATVVASVTGVLLLAVFKYTSAQDAIRRVRNDINANLLALKLFKDSAMVSLLAQGRILRAPSGSSYSPSCRCWSWPCRSLSCWDNWHSGIKLGRSEWGKSP